VASVDDAFLARVAEVLTLGPSPVLLDPATAQVLDFRIVRAAHPPTVIVRYVRHGQECFFDFSLDDDTWSFGDAEEAAELVWIDLQETLTSID
jgi:hypothetical protein